MLAEIAGTGNVETAELDLRTPSFAFLKLPAKVLFFTNSVFAALSQGMLAGFLRAFAQLPGARVCAFEPIAAQMTDQFPAHKPRFKLEGMRQVGLSEWVWPELKDAESAGLIKFERIIPDMVGAIASNCLSLIQFSSAL
jgi:hypothetical protein